MSSKTPDELMDTIYYILEPHASFIQKGGDEDVRYFIPQEILEILAWIALNVALPILSGVTTSILADRFKDKDEALKAMELEKTELERLKADVRHALEKLNSEEAPSKEQIVIAKASLADVLRINGWPKNLAEFDSERTLAEVHLLIWESEIWGKDG